MGKKKSDEDELLAKKLAKMAKPDRDKACQRILYARKMGWTGIDFWDWEDQVPNVSDLVGIRPDGSFDFLPCFEEGDEVEAGN